MKVAIDKKGKKVYITSAIKESEMVFDLKESTYYLEKLLINEEIKNVYTNMTILKEITTVINDVSTIKVVGVENDLELKDYAILSKLKNIDEFICHDMDEELFIKCTNKLPYKITTLKKYYKKSDFIIVNDLTTRSNIFYKKQVILYETFNESDVRAFGNFLKQNNHLTKIEYYGFNEIEIDRFINELKKHEKSNITIKLNQQKESQKQIDDAVKNLRRKYRKYLREHQVKIKIYYTEEYKSKNILKQLNLNVARICLLLLFATTASIYIISKIHTYNSKNDQQILEDKIEDITEIKENIISPAEVEKEEVKTNTKKPTNKKEKTYEKNIPMLKKINPDFAGWLSVKNTKISYPVVKSNNNSYYLNRAFDKSYNINGSLFMDYRNRKNFQDQNTIIYGHDSENGVMFGTLRNVLSKNWYKNKANQTFTIDTDSGTIKAEIFSIYTIKSTNDYLQVVFAEDEFQSFINKLVKRSIYNFGNKPTTSDRIITLSTCYITSSKRLVVHAKIK